MRSPSPSVVLEPGIAFILGPRQQNSHQQVEAQAGRISAQAQEEEPQSLEQFCSRMVGLSRQRSGWASFWDPHGLTSCMDRGWASMVIDTTSPTSKPRLPAGTFFFFLAQAQLSRPGACFPFSETWAFIVFTTRGPLTSFAFYGREIFTWVGGRWSMRLWAGICPSLGLYFLICTRTR